jgi:hypothetical protein
VRGIRHVDAVCRNRKSAIQDRLAVLAATGGVSCQNSCTSCLGSDHYAGARIPAGDETGNMAARNGVVTKREILCGVSVWSLKASSSFGNSSFKDFANALCRSRLRV